MNKALVKLTGLILVAVSIGLIIRLIKIEDAEELVIFSSYLFIIAMAIITLLFGVMILISNVNEDDNKK